MNFEDAIAELKTGKLIRRSGWDENRWLVLLDHGEALKHGGLMREWIGMKTSPDKRPRQWTSTIHDIVAQDWRIKEESPIPTGEHYRGMRSIIAHVKKEALED